MGRWKKDSKKEQIKLSLVDRFNSGERITKDQAIRDYFETKTVLAAVVAKEDMGRMFTSLKKYYRKEGATFCCVNRNWEWGIPEDDLDHQLSINGAFEQAKVMAENVRVQIKNANRNGLLLDKTEKENLSFDKTKQTLIE